MRAATQEEQFDRERDYRRHEWRPGDAPTFDQRAAVADLCGYCEGVVGAGVLVDEVELGLRKRIAVALVAFNMPSKAERVPA